MRNCTNSDKGKEKLYMKKMRKGAAVLLLLLSLCVPAVDVSADVRNEPAEYTVEYIARDGETETLLARETYRAPAGRTVNVPHREFDNYVKEAGQDMTLPVTADGKAVLNLYYDREIWTINLHEEADHESGSSDSLIRRCRRNRRSRRSRKLRMRRKSRRSRRSRIRGTGRL